jgi:hypothetical protein
MGKPLWIMSKEDKNNGMTYALLSAAISLEAWASLTASLYASSKILFLVENPLFFQPLDSGGSLSQLEWYDIECALLTKARSFNSFSLRVT